MSSEVRREERRLRGGRGGINTRGRSAPGGVGEERETIKGDLGALRDRSSGSIAQQVGQPLLKSASLSSPIRIRKLIRMHTTFTDLQKPTNHNQ